ncbi:MAG: cell division protein FtsQ [Prevotella sp.]|nr:cell division protein FtsQ [Prevotella sp.]
MINWKKTLLVTVNVGIAAYLVLAATVLSRGAGQDVVCTDVRISIEQGVIRGFLSADKVKHTLIAGGIYPVGQKMTNVNLRNMEEMLCRQELIGQAECYKTQDGQVNIRVSERVPVIRVMADGGADYYVDEDGKPMHGTDYACNLMVATGCISQPYAARVLAPIGRMIMTDDFWRNQIEQLNVLQDSTIEMVPRVGNHIIYLGQPRNIRKKLERLRKFYDYGLSQVGWNKYSRISVEYSNQIVCKKR